MTTYGPEISTAITNLSELDIDADCGDTPVETPPKSFDRPRWPKRPSTTPAALDAAWCSLVFESTESKGEVVTPPAPPVSDPDAALRDLCGNAVASYERRTPLLCNAKSLIFFDLCGPNFVL